MDGGGTQDCLEADGDVSAGLIPGLVGASGSTAGDAGVKSSVVSVFGDGATTLEAKEHKKDAVILVIVAHCFCLCDVKGFDILPPGLRGESAIDAGAGPYKAAGPAKEVLVNIFVPRMPSILFNNYAFI